MKAIKNVILDLGGVIINIDPLQTLYTLENHGMKDVEAAFEKINSAGIFDRVERGEITEEEMVEEIKTLIPHAPSGEIILEAWNSLLLDLPQERGEMVEKLAEKYPLYLLSNTSPGHIRIIDSMVKKQFGWRDLREPFTKAFYSYEMGTRKPDPLIFEKMLDEAGIQAEESIFLDDLISNVESARRVGLHTRLVTPQEGLIEIARREFLNA